MDIAINKKKSSLPYRNILWGVALVAAFFIVKYLWYLGQSDYSVDKDSIVSDVVKRGDFVVSVRGNGVLVPDKIQWLSVSVEARVSQLVLKPGNVVQTGDLIVELSNPQLVQQLAEATWEHEALDAEVMAERVAQESLIQQQKSQLLNAKLDYESGVNEFEARKELIETGAVSKLEYNKARIEMDQFKQRWQSSQEQLTKMQENLVAQNIARKARLSKSQKSLERIQQQVDSLQVKATMDGMVLELPLELGQRLTIGSNIAKLAERKSLIAELQVPELQIRDVAIEQRVIIDTRNNKIEGVVTRVDPAVVNGNVQVDVRLLGDLPKDARADLSVDGEIIVAEIADALFVDRPLFAQTKSSSGFYKITEGGSFAQKVQVEVGDGSINQIQIVNGLQEGDEIITSDPSRFESYNKFRIN